jgi:predicted AAA+ superfamily ATPase
MHPFNRRELAGRTTETPFIKRFFDELTISGAEETISIPLSEIAQGGMPSVCLGKMKDPTNWFNGYEHTYLDRDIRDLGRISDIITFRGLLRLAALRTGGILSLSDLGRDARLKSATVTGYLSLMELSCIFYRLAPYLRNPASRLIKSPKLYLGDSGIACYLAEVEELTADNRLKGALLETYVAQNLVSILDATWPRANIYFWYIQGRHEVDFIIEAGNRCLAIEVKAASRWEKEDLASLKAFIACTPHCSAAILAYNGTTPVQLGDKLWAIPLSLLLS